MRRIAVVCFPLVEDDSQTKVKWYLSGRADFMMVQLFGKITQAQLLFIRGVNEGDGENNAG
jgi:hypothetical protein